VQPVVRGTEHKYALFIKHKTSTRDFFRNVTLYSRVKVNRRFGGNIISKFRVEEQAKKETSSVCCLLQADFLLDLMFDPEDTTRR
jgi:hypothetical protein